MNTCTICRNRFEAESPAVLFISAYGAKRVLCPSCEGLLDRATAEENIPEKEEAVKSLHMLATNIKDPAALEALSAILSGEADEDAPTADEEAEMEAVFDEIKKEEEEAAALAEPQKANVLDYLLPALFAVVILVFIVWYFFFR